jgi:hypothetical protein
VPCRPVALVSGPSVGGVEGGGVPHRTTEALFDLVNLTADPAADLHAARVRHCGRETLLITLPKASPWATSTA